MSILSSGVNHLLVRPLAGIFLFGVVFTDDGQHLIKVWYGPSGIINAINADNSLTLSWWLWWQYFPSLCALWRVMT